MQVAPAEFLLRLAVASAYLYPPLAAIFDPYSWIGYFPPFLLNAAGGYDLVLLHVFGGIEFLLALWILLGKRIFVPSVLAALGLIGIVLFNLPQFDVLFRDVSIALAACALALMHRKASASA